MKTTFRWLVSLLAIAGFFMGCETFKQQPEKSKPCACKKTFKVKKWSREKNETVKETVIVSTTYNCRQIVLTTTGKLDPDLEKYLTDKGYHKVKTCPCAPNLQLWEHDPNQTVDGVGVVVGGQKPPDGVGGMSLNYDINLPDPVNFKGQLDNDSLNPEDWIPPSNTKPIRVAIIDSGVDPNNDYIKRYLVGNAGACGNISTIEHDMPPPIKYGMNMVDPNQPPFDENGHGTFVNGVLVGIPDYIRQPSNLIKPPVEILNVRFTAGTSKSGTLFDAVCGMYYAIQEGAQVLNASWGFLDDVQPAMMEPLIKTMEANNVVMVAGMGNDSEDLTTGTLRFWPAAFAETTTDNVISVGALITGETDMAPFSNIADPPRMSLTTWGQDLVSADLTSNGTNPDALAQNSGTSFATPIVVRAIVFNKVGTPLPKVKTGLDGNSTPLPTSSNYKVLKYSHSENPW